MIVDSTRGHDYRTEPLLMAGRGRDGRRLGKEEVVGGKEGKKMGVDGIAPIL